MLSKKAKRRFSTFIAVGICVFTLASTFTSTIAWFSYSKNTTASGMTISVRLGDTDVQGVTVHRCNLQASTKDVLQFYSEPSVTITGHGAVSAHSGIEMNDYSTLNQTQPVLLLFTFSDGIVAEDINITANASTPTFVSAATAQNISAFPFSSAVCFKCKSYTSDTFQFTNIVVNDLGSAMSFVSIVKNEDNVVTSTPYTDSLTLYSGTGSTVITYVAVILDYYADAIDYIVDNTNYEVFNENDNCIDFYCDWTLAI